jgi:phenylpropionate dioxygenase-like ring-hydroxylating dioxygenase large terminal subunit
MDHATQVELTREVFGHLDANTTCRLDHVTHHPVSAYASAEVLRKEQEILFRQYGLVTGLSCQLAEPGDYLTDDFSGVPILVVRGRDGKVRAFMNVCAHRGAKVVDGCGSGKRAFSCPYHGWTYDDAGKLVGLPDPQSFPGVDPADHGLRELPAEEKYGLIWVRPSTGGEPLDVDAQLQGLAPELENYHLEDYHHYETRVLKHKMNWKIVLDTFLEPYHFAALHSATVGPIFFPNLCLFHPFGSNLREVLPRRTIQKLRDQPESDWDLIPHTALVYILFPNTVFVMQTDHAEIWRVYPSRDRVDECVMYLDFFIPEPATTESARGHWDRNMDLTVRTVVEEDFPVGEGIQAGLASGALEKIVYGRNEPALAHFQRSVTAALG